MRHRPVYLSPRDSGGPRRANSTSVAKRPRKMAHRRARATGIQPTNYRCVVWWSKGCSRLGVSNTKSSPPGFSTRQNSRAQISRSGCSMCSRTPIRAITSKLSSVKTAACAASEVEQTEPLQGSAAVKSSQQIFAEPVRALAGVILPPPLVPTARLRGLRFWPAPNVLEELRVEVRRSRESTTLCGAGVR